MSDENNRKVVTELIIMNMKFGWCDLMEWKKWLNGIDGDKDFDKPTLYPMGFEKRT